jgi:2-keto-4-pentenoate hydratase
LRGIRMLQALEHAVASRLWEASVTKVPCPPVRHDIGEGNIAAAYRIQNANARRRIAGGAALVGFKVGMTSAAVQQQLGYFEPNFGHLFGDHEFQHGDSIPKGTLIQPRGEGEIAFVLGKDLEQESVRVSDVIRSIEYAVCSIEVLDSRIVGWDIGPADSIADNGSGGAHVLGTFPHKITDCDLVLCGMVARRNGEIASLGVGAASMTNPLLAVRWLAEKLARTDRPLRAGDVVLSGSLGPIVTLTPGDVFEVEIGGLGTVCVHLATSQRQSDQAVSQSY